MPLPGYSRRASPAQRQDGRRGRRPCDTVPADALPRPAGLSRPCRLRARRSRPAVVLRLDGIAVRRLPAPWRAAPVAGGGGAALPLAVVAAAGATGWGGGGRPGLGATRP